MSVERQKVLIIDDTALNIEQIDAALSDEVEILFATSGAEGEELAIREAPDLILLDIVMPDIDGYTLCQRLKADPRTCPIPIIFITALDSDVDEARGLELGAIDYLSKPIRAAILRARVRNHLELKRHRDLLERLSFLDGLTGIANRRHFDHQLELEWRRALRNKKSLALIMADVDHFKLYNDSYGHLAGDDCLKKVAQTIAGTIRRAGDLPARYGGEEFACILPETELQGALHVARAMCQAVARLELPHEPSPHHLVTLSCGCAACPVEASASAEELILAADRLLYQAKASGRNRACAG